MTTSSRRSIKRRPWADPLYLDGVLIITTPNNGAYTDRIGKKGGGSYAYKVCEEGTQTCSNEATVSF